MSVMNSYRNSIQDNIVLHLTVLVILGVAIWSLYYSQIFHGLISGDALDYAGIARNVYRGQGFISGEITPLQLAFKEGLPQPNLWRAPLHILVIAAAFHLFGLSDLSVIITSTLFFFLSIPAVYMLIKKLFPSMIAFFGTLFFISSPSVLYYSISGLRESMALFWMTLLLTLFLIDKEEKTWLYFIAGSVAGLLYLTRYNAIFFLAPILIYIYLTQKNEKFLCLARFFISFAIIVTPWLWRNYLLVGNPFFSLQKFEVAMFTSTYPGYSLYMIPELLSVPKFVLSHFKDIFIKAIRGFGTFYITFPTPGFGGIGRYVMIFFIASIFHRFDKEQEKFRWLVYSMILLQMFALAFIHHLPRLFFIFVPFFAAFGVAFFVHLIENLKASALKETLIYILTLTVLILAPLVQAINPFDRGSDMLYYTQDQIKYIKSVSSRNGVIVTDIPDVVSWHADRVAVDIPVKPAMMEIIEDKVPVQAIYLSSILHQWEEVGKGWLKIRDKKPTRFREYTLQHQFPDGSLLYVKEKL